MVEPIARIRPRPDQDAAVHAIVQAFTSGLDRAQLIAASGTGKTLIGLWAVEALDCRLAIYFAPSLALIRQTAISWFRNADTRTRMEALCICSDETVAEDIPRADLPIPVTTDPEIAAGFLARQPEDGTRLIIFATYQSVGRLETALAAALSHSETRLPDLLLCDEAHRIAGPEGKMFQAVLDADRVPARHRLFLTATPRIVATHHAREESEAYLASMDDERRFGPVVYRLSFGDAIQLGLLAEYRITVLAVSDGEVSQLFSAPDDDLVSLAQAAAIVRALSDGVFRHGLSFHLTRKAASRFVDALHRIGTDVPWRFDTVFGDTPVVQRFAWVQRLLAARGGVIASAKALAEGVDIPAVDAVIFVDARRSVVDIAQAIGRALRLDPDRPGKVAHVAVPVVIKQGLRAEDQLADSQWEPVWRVVSALSAHDDRLERDLALKLHMRAREDAGNRSASAPAGLLERSLVLALPPEIPLRRFARAIVMRAVDEAGDPFEYGFERLRVHVLETGTAAVQVGYTSADGFALGRWAASLRSAYREGRLTEERATRLEELPGWYWSRDDAEWTWGYDELRGRVHRRGRLRLPRDWWTPRDGWLGAWVAMRRAEYWQGKLGKRRIQALEALPTWTWGRFTPVPSGRLSAFPHDAALLERVAVLGSQLPAPASELLRPEPRPDVHYRRPLPLPALAAWVTHAYVPAALRCAGLVRYAAAFQHLEPPYSDAEIPEAIRLMQSLAEDLSVIEHAGADVGLVLRFSQLQGYLFLAERFTAASADAFWKAEWDVHAEQWPQLARLVAVARGLVAQALVFGAARWIAQHALDPRLRALSKLVGLARRRDRDGSGEPLERLIARHLSDPRDCGLAIGEANDRQLRQILSEVERLQEQARRRRRGRRILDRLAVLPAPGEYPSLKALAEPLDEYAAYGQHVRARSLPNGPGRTWRPVGERLSPVDRTRVAAERWRRRVHEDWVNRLGIPVRGSRFDTLWVRGRQDLVVQVADGWWSLGRKDGWKHTFLLREERVTTAVAGKRKMAVITVPRALSLAKLRATRLSGLSNHFKKAVLLAAEPMYRASPTNETRLFHAVWIRLAPPPKAKGMRVPKNAQRGAYILEDGVLEVNGTLIVRAIPNEVGEPPWRDAKALDPGAPGVIPGEVVWAPRPASWGRPAPPDAMTLPGPAAVSRATGSPARSLMPDGTVVEDREERFHFNAAAAREYFAENGDLLPPKDARPRGVNLYQWLKNQELQIASGTLPPDRAAVLDELPGWHDRQLQRTLGSARPRTRRGPRHRNRGETPIGEDPQPHATSFAGDRDEDLPDQPA